MTGYLRIYRQVLTDPIFRDRQEALCYIWMALMAAWSPCTIYDQGQKYDLDRGELAASLRSISTLFGWSRSKVDRFLKRLEEGQRITRIVSTKGRKSQIIRLENYESFYGQTDGLETVATPQEKQKQDSLKKEESNKTNQTKHSGSSAACLQSNVDNKRSREELQAIAEKSLEISGLQSVANFAPGFHDLSPIAAWLHAGATPEDDIYPLVQAKAKASIRSWAYFTPSIMEALARRSYLNDQNLNGQNLDTQSLTAQNLKEADDEGSFITTNTHTTPNPARGPAAARAGRPGSAHALMLAGALAEAERSEGGG